MPSCPARWTRATSAIIERYAREQGYVRPNERVFVDISGK